MFLDLREAFKNRNMTILYLMPVAKFKLFVDRFDLHPSASNIPDKIS